MTATLRTRTGRSLVTLQVADTSRHIILHLPTGPVWFERTYDEEATFLELHPLLVVSERRLPRA